MKKFQEKLKQLKGKNRYRSLRLQDGFDLTSNDYLGLAAHPLLRKAAIDFVQQSGVIGAGGSRLLRGHMQAHQELEDYAAEYFAAPASLYFSSGYQANAALFQALPSRHDTIIFDEYVHASAREAIQNSDARRIKVRHNDLLGFENALKEAKASEREHIWIAVESVYSMDGDVAPLEALYDLASEYDAVLIVDEAHGTGIFGPRGRGVSEDLVVQHGYDRMIVLHTCGKAIGVAGGLICAAKEVVEMMVNSARGFIYSTAPLPVQAHLVQTSLGILAGEEGQKRREKLLQISKVAKEIFGGHGTHIVPILIGNDEAAVEVAERLSSKGWDIRAIRPPTVPEGSARLRLSLNCDLSEADLRKFAADLDSFSQQEAA